MNARNILLVGCGEIATALGLQWASKGHQVWGLRRQAGRLPDAINECIADVCEPASLERLNELTLDYVVITLTPQSMTDEGYRSVFVDGLDNVLAQLACQRQLKHILFVSSTSVYHQADHQWVDEDSATLPQRFSGQRLLQAEQLLAASGLRHSCIRFGGIYGPGRRRLIDQVLAKQGNAEQPPLYTNRIHLDDCVGFLAHLVAMAERGETLQRIYLAVDNQPVPLWELQRWMAGQLGIAVDSLVVGKLRNGSSKRCKNQRLRASNYSLIYPSYREGYAPLLQLERN